MNDLIIFNYLYNQYSRFEQRGRSNVRKNNTMAIHCAIILTQKDNQLTPKVSEVLLSTEGLPQLVRTIA